MRPKQTAANQGMGPFDNGTNVTEEIHTEWVDLEEFSALVGHPLELVRKELFLNEKDSSQQKIELSELRKAMACLLDRTFSDKTS